MTIITAPFYLHFMYTRRRALALGALSVGTLTGCSGASDLAGEGPIERTASPAILSESAVSETEYELSRKDKKTIEQEVSAAGQSRRIIANNQLTFYTKTIEDIEAGLFVVIATPSFSFAGQTLNPVAGMSNQDVVDQFGQRLGGLQSATESETLSQNVLGTDTTISKFNSKGTYNGREFDVYAYLGKVVNEGDVVIAGGAYPQAYDSAEAEITESLFTDIEHPA